ncbi:MAG: NAD(P)H-hydrate dehydratase [Ruminococcaceae bacterium]|nr:NAD(P)H-hydrate dehydratase [Oscillospiraceae bacterium]
MKEILSVENMRKSDAHTIATKVPSTELMYRAGKAVADSVEWRAPVGIVCGWGNNAGDGYVIALELKKKNIDCTLLLLGERFSADGKYYFDKCAEAGIHYELCTESTDLSRFSTLVDCIFGTGFSGGVRGVAKEVIEKYNAADAYKVSVDINSGLGGDTGMGETVCLSDLTCSIGSFKPGHFLNRAKDVMKSKVNLDIGIKPIDNPYYLYEPTASVFPERKNFSNKSTWGYVALIGGSKRYSGAIRLAAMANAAMRSGAGVAMLAVPGTLAPMMMPEILEATVYPFSEADGGILFNENELSELCRRTKSIAFGMGIGLSDEARKSLAYLLKNYKGTLTVDADGLTALSRLGSDAIKNSKCKLILTPHNMEFSRLSGLTVDDILAAPIDSAKEYARENGCVLLLKGPSTIVTDGETVYVIEKGCPGMATAGSGDVLSGILAATSAYIPDPLEAAALAAYVNGLAGEIAESSINPVSMIASDTVSAIPKAIGRILKNEAD